MRSELPWLPATQKYSLTGALPLMHLGRSVESPIMPPIHFAVILAGNLQAAQASENAPCECFPARPPRAENISISLRWYRPAAAPPAAAAPRQCDTPPS